MVKNQKGNVIVIIVVVLAVLAIFVLGFWVIFNSKKQSSNLLKEREIVQPHTKESQEQ